MKFGYNHGGLHIDIFIDSDKLSALSEGAVVLETVTNLVCKERDEAVERVGTGLCDSSPEHCVAVPRDAGIDKPKQPVADEFIDPFNVSRYLPHKG